MQHPCTCGAVPSGWNSLNFSIGVRVIYPLLVSFFILTAWDLPCWAEDLPAPISIAPAPPPNSVLIFGGQYTTEAMGQSLIPFSVNHENNYMVGGAYERDFFVPTWSYGWLLGGEIGIADRFGLGEGGELWGGLNIRNTGVVFFDFVRIAPGITVGLSGITKPVGIELQREIIDHGNAYFLGYLGPELAFSFQEFPNIELVYRLQHRSGADGFFGHMLEGANANTFGVRYRF
jgi:hypothetical protein